MKIKETKKEISQTINLKELLGRSPTPQERVSIGQDLIDRILERTESGKSLSGHKFKAYSKEYKDSLDFQAFGKTNRVNMTLTGDMLASIDILKETKDTITIGIAGDEAPKAFNHQTGDTVPKRRFFGVTKGDTKKAVRDNKNSNVEAPSEDNFVDRALDTLNIGDFFNGED